MKGKEGPGNFETWVLKSKGLGYLKGKILLDL
jgi:hypothetical protein